jgi:hypothetical protein
MASRELRSTGVVRGACPFGASAIFKRCTCMARFAAANCYSGAFNVKRMGRYLKIIMAAPAWTPPKRAKNSQTDPPNCDVAPICPIGNRFQVHSSSASGQRAVNEARF